MRFFPLQIWLNKSISALPGWYSSCRLVGDFNCKQRSGYLSFRFLLCEPGNNRGRRDLSQASPAPLNLAGASESLGEF